MKKKNKKVAVTPMTPSDTEVSSVENSFAAPVAKSSNPYLNELSDFDVETDLSSVDTPVAAGEAVMADSDVVFAPSEESVVEEPFDTFENAAADFGSDAEASVFDDTEPEKDNAQENGNTFSDECEAAPFSSAVLLNELSDYSADAVLYDGAPVSDAEEDAETDGAEDNADEAPAKTHKQLRKERITGNDRFSFVMTVINLIFTGLWTLVYIFLDIDRALSFTFAQLQAESVNLQYYSLNFSSPLMSVLYYLLYLIPAICLIWAVSVAVAYRKKKTLCSKKLIFATLGTSLAAAVAAVIDLAFLRILAG